MQLQLNYLDWESLGVQSRKCYEVATKHGKPVIVMEPVKGGTLAKVPEELEQMFKAREPDLSVPSWAIRFAASLDNVMVVLSGMSNMEQLLDNTGYMRDFRPLNEEDFSLYNLDLQEIKEKVWTPQRSYYDNLTLEHGKASDCIRCGQCEAMCPQHLPIRKYLEDVARHFES